MICGNPQGSNLRSLFYISINATPYDASPEVYLEPSRTCMIFEKIVNGFYIYIYKYTYIYRRYRRYRRYRDFLLQEHCKKLFNLMGIFWYDIKYVEVDVNWLLKVKTHLEKLEKIQSKIKRKKLRKMSTNPLLKKMVLENLINTFRFLNSDMILMHFVILNFQTLRIFTPFLQ